MLERDDAAVGAVVHAQVVLSLMRRVGCRARAAWTTAQLTWLRAEACCECTKEAHGHRDRCNQFVVWADRSGTGKGAWEVRRLRDPRRPPCDILCAVCYAKVTGQVPKGA